MWMDAYVQQILMRQQIAESDRAAALRHLVRSARSAQAQRPWWATIQRLVRSATAFSSRRPAERVAVR